jgi:hypothetical protein
MLLPMRVGEIREWLQARPFRPFTMHVADGGSLLVKHEDYVALSPTGRTMLVYRGDNTDRFQEVELLMVTRLETARRNGAKKRRK